jgi:RimJ/RimL family protein N-acetyltransferase
MALIQPQVFTLRTGEAVLVRSATPGDAAAIECLLRGVCEEREYLVTEPQEFTWTASDFQKKIAMALQTPTAVRLCALVGGELIGELAAEAGTRRRREHRLRVSMAVARAWRGRGAGMALLEALLAWAHRHPLIEKVSLGVFAHNERAIRLYRRMGFQEEGRRVREFRLAPGRYADEVLMARFVKFPPDEPGT